MLLGGMVAVKGKFASAEWLRPAAQRDLIFVVNAFDAARFGELGVELGSEQIREALTDGFGTRDAGEALDFGIPAFHAIVESGGYDANVNCLDDVLAELF